MNCDICGAQYTVISCGKPHHDSAFCSHCFPNLNKCCPVAGCLSKDIETANSVESEDDEAQMNLSSNSNLMNAYSEELENYDNSAPSKLHSTTPCPLNEGPACAAMGDTEIPAEEKDRDEEKMEDVNEYEDASENEEKHISIYYLDVGMGDSTLIVDEECGCVILIDCGSTKNADVAGIPSLQFIFARVIEAAEISGRSPTIDIVYFTHPDRDHYNMFPELVKLFDVKDPLRVMQFIVGGKKTGYNTNEVNGKYLSNRNVTSFENPVGQQEAVGFRNFTIQVLCANLVPTHGESPTNAASLCILLNVYCKGSINHKLLFMGDGETTVEQTLLANPVIKDCLALKIGHHGSEKSCSKEFLDCVYPKFAFASADMTWSHPYTSIMQRLMDLPSLNRTLENDPSHYIVHGEGGSRNRSYQNVSTSSEVYTNIVGIHDDHSNSQAAKEAQKAGDNPVEAIGVRHDLHIDLESGAVQHEDSNPKADQDPPYENIF
jgi:beta-lactamase superfamily II metal-dependent hydrolase